MPAYHPAQATIVQNLNRFNVLDCGRRFGKDVIQRNYACEALLAGEPVAWYEPSFKSLEPNWDWFVDTFATVQKDKSEVSRRLEISTGGFIEMWSLQDQDASRGRHYKKAIINEASSIPKLDYSWNHVIRITLADLQGGAMFGSTPRGRNFFWNLYRLGEDDKQKEWSSWHYTTWDNPYIPRAEIEAIKNSDMPEIIYRQEIMAEFIDDQGGVFRRVQEAAILEPIEPQRGRQYAAGVDVASSIDYTVVTVMDTESKQMVFMDRFNRVDYPVLEDRLASLYAKWGLYNMTIEANSIGRPVLDHMAMRGLVVTPFTTTNQTKQAVIQSLQSAFEHGNIQILNDPVLVGELLSFEASRNNSGSFSYSAPAGMHDDCVMSLAIAWYGCSGVDWLVS
jgi:phage terminase large subunit-like protein